MDDAGQIDLGECLDACHPAAFEHGWNNQGPSAMLPITPAGKYTTPSRLRWLWATFSSRLRDRDTAKVVSQRASSSGLPILMCEGKLWHLHSHRLKELDRDERQAVRTLIVVAAGVFVAVAALLTVVRLFGLPPQTQYAMVRLF